MQVSYSQPVDLVVSLEAFVAVVTSGSFTQAADEVGIPQPVLSRRIKALEHELGGLVFDRSRRQIKTTPLGIALLPLAEDLLGRAAAIHDVVRARTGDRVLAIGVPPDSDAQLLADVVGMSRAVGVSAVIRELPLQERIEGLADGTLALAALRVPEDLATVAVPTGLGSTDTAWIPVGRMGVYLEDLRARRDTGAAGRTVWVTAEDQQFTSYRELLESASDRAGLTACQFRNVGSMSEAVVDVLAGNAVILCSEAFARATGLAWSPLLRDDLARQYDLRISRSAHLDPPSVRLLETLKPTLARSLGATGTRAAVTSVNSPSPLATSA